MIEQLSAHGVLPTDLSPSLMKFAKVRNPLANSKISQEAIESTVTLHANSIKSQESLHVEEPSNFQDQSDIDIDIRWTLLCDLFLVLISDSVYDSRSRTLLEYFGKCLDVSKLEITKFEEKVTDALEIEEASEQTWKETTLMEDRRKKDRRKKYMYVGLATVGGGLVLGLSAGLLAPVIGAGLAAGFTTIGITGTSGFLAGAGGAALVTTTGAAMGVKIGSQGMANRMGHVTTFEFRPLHNHKRVNLVITVSGWLLGNEDDVRLPFSTVDPIMGDIYSLLWEPEMLKSMGQTINILATEALTQSIQQILGATILTGLMASLQLPMALSKLSYLLDNPWNVSLDRAWTSGRIMAETLINRNLGVRPVTLVGFSLGARVIYSCLVQLAKKEAFGLVQDVFIFGAPVVAKKDQFALARSVVSGRFVNGYSKKDWVLGYLFRATSGGLGRVAGLSSVDGVQGLENYDNTDLVDGHMGYRKAMPILLSRLGWEVLSEDFAEIEDPDPEKHRERQRQLIEEFDVAKKHMERETAKGKKKKKSFFSWGRKEEKALWEMYEREIEDQHSKESAPKIEKSTQPGTPNDPIAPSNPAMFDADAIQKELVDLMHSDKLPANQKLEDYVPTQEISRRNSRADESIEMSFDPFEDDHEDRNVASMTFPSSGRTERPPLSTLNNTAATQSTTALPTVPNPLQVPTRSASSGTHYNNPFAVQSPEISIPTPPSVGHTRSSTSSRQVSSSSLNRLPSTDNSTAQQQKFAASTPTLANTQHPKPQPPPVERAQSDGVTMTFDDFE